MNAPGHAAFWLREHCRGLANPTPREHDLGRDETNVFRRCRFCRLLRRLRHSQNDQTREIERTAGNYCQSKGQRLVITTAGDSEVFNCVPDAPGTSGNAGIGAAKPVSAREHAN